MPRKPRFDTRNGIYHVMAKGNDGRLLFRQKADFYKFIHILKDSREKDPHQLLSYCLMPNHIHLLMETVEIPLSRIMHRLLLRYSLYFNKRYLRSGHLFQDRFKAKPCKQENYLLQLLVYIHDNPRKAGLPDSESTYPYSSERIYQKKVAITSPVNNLRALELIGPSPMAAWKSYHYHLLYTRSKNTDLKIQDQHSLRKNPVFHPDKEVYFSSNPLPEPAKEDTKFDFLINVPLDHICAVLAEVMGVEKNAIRGKSKQKQVSLARGTLIYITRAAGWRSVEIRKEFGFNPGTIAHHLSRFRQDSLSKEIEEILEKLTLSFNSCDH